MKRELAVLFFGLFSSYCFAEPELKGTPVELTAYLSGIPSTINAIASSTMNANADKAVVTLVVKTENELLSIALKANQQIKERVATYLESKGFNNTKIMSSKLSSTSEYGFFSDQPTNYKVNNAVLLNISSEQELLDISEVFLVGTRFEHTESEKFKSMPLESAIKNALTKKDIYQKTLGAQLILSEITESTEGSAVQTEVVKSRRSAPNYNNALSANFGALVYKSTSLFDSKFNKARYYDS